MSYLEALGLTQSRDDTDPLEAIRRVADDSGVNPDFLVGLARLETGMGSKSIRGDGQDTRNLFNVKDFGGGGVRAVDKAEGSNDAYRKYGSYDESARDLVSLLQRKYPDALKAESPEEFATALKQGGYATDPAYVDKLTKTIGGTTGGASTRSRTPTLDWLMADQGKQGDDSDFAQKLNFLNQNKPKESRGVGGFVKDTGLDLAKGVVGFGESVVGLGNLASFGLLGKTAEAVGYDPKQTSAFLSGLQSDARQQSDREVSETKGFWNTLGALGTHPDVLFGNIVESLPGTVGAGAVGGMLVKRLAATAATEAAALGLTEKAATDFIAQKVKEQTFKIAAAASGAEGAQSAGSIAESGRQAGKDWSDYVAPALAAGLGTAAIGMVSGKIGQKLGIGDVETDIAARAAGVKGVATSQGGIVKRIGGEMLKEGALEEMPQSYQEKAFENLATGRPWQEGTSEAAAQGLMAGAGMAGGHAVLTGHAAPKDAAPAEQTVSPADPLQIGNTPDPMIGFPDGTVARRSEVDAYINSLPEDQRVAARAKLQGLEKQPAKPDDILKTETVDDAISAFTQSVSAPVAPAISEEDDLAQLVQSEARNKQVMLAQMDQDRAKQAELDQIPSIAAEQNTTQEALQRAATLETPTAMGTAFGKLFDQTIAPEPEAPPAPAPKPAPEPRIVERQDGMMAMPRELAELRVEMNGGEVVRILNRNGKYAFTVLADESKPSLARIAKEPNVSLPQRVLAANTEGSGYDGNKPADGMGDRGNAGQRPGYDATGLPNAELVEPDKPASQVPAAAVDERLIPKSKRDVKNPQTPVSGNPGTPNPQTPAVEARTDTFSKPAAVDGVPGAGTAAKVQPEGVKAEPQGNATVAPNLPGIYKLGNGSFARFQDGIWYRGEDTPQKALKTEMAASAMKAKDRTPDQSWEPHAGFTLDAYGATKSLKPLSKTDRAKISETSEQKQAPAPANIAPVATESVATGTGPVGRNNVPLTEGGKPYKDKRDADAARKSQPAMRVKRVDGGYALVEKTPAQLAAQEKAGKRLSQPRTSPKGEPIPAHSMIAAAGGLSKETMSDMGFGDNPKVGNRSLFAATGGLTIEQATEKLVEDGYLQEGASHSQAMDLIKRSLTNPQYTPEGTERMAAKELEDQEAAYHAEQEALALAQELADTEDAALVAAFEADILEMPQGLAQSDMGMEEALFVAGFTQEEIANGNETGEIQAAVGQPDAEPKNERSEGAQGAVEPEAGSGPQDSQGRDSTPGQDQGIGSQEGLTLTAPSRQEVLAQQTAVEAEAKRKEEGGDKPIQSKVTGDTPDMFNTQGSVFDVPAEPEAPASQSKQEPDTGTDIPPRYFKSVKVDHTVWIEDENKSDIVKVSAKDALASIKEDRENYEKLLVCMKG